MCKSCKRDDYEIKKFRMRQGAVDVDDFRETFPHVKSAKPKARKRKRGCAGNDNGPHVYVWVPVTNDEYSWDSYRIFYEYFGFAKSEVKTCAGCGKRGKIRNTERYEAEDEKWYRKNYKNVTSRYRGVPMPGNYMARYRMGIRWKPGTYNWETRVPEFRAYVDKKYRLERGIF